MKKMPLFGGIVVVLGITMGIGLLLFSRKQELGIAPTPTASAEAQTTPPAESKGAIEGTLSFPSESIPEDMQICVETMTHEQVVCTSEHIEVSSPQGSGLGYRLEVDPGEYYVYAFVPSNEKNKAYYSEFVICGLLASCPSHTPIAINVGSGEIVSGINPHDWYAASAQ